MQFWTKLVKRQNDITLILSEAGGVLMLFCLLLTRLLSHTDKFLELALVGALAGFALMLIGWILRRGKAARPRIIDTDIIISTGEIRIGDRSFPVDQVEYLDFLVNSYSGMPGPWIRWRRVIHNGADNKLYFTADGKQHAYGFYLEDKMAMQRLGLLFREFYRERIRFRERNRGGRTFLFEQVVDRKAFEEAKRKEGYE